LAAIHVWSATCLEALAVLTIARAIVVAASDTREWWSVRAVTTTADTVAAREIIAGRPVFATPASSWRIAQIQLIH